MVPGRDREDSCDGPEQQHIIPFLLNDGIGTEANRELREKIEAKYAEALRSAGFFRRIYLKFKMRREIEDREGRLLRTH